MDYKKTLTVKNDEIKVKESFEDFKSISEAVDRYNDKIESNKKKYSSLYEVNEFQTHLDYEIMNMCNMLLNKYGDLGFVDKENVYSVFVKHFAGHFITEKIEIEETEDETEIDEI